MSGAASGATVARVPYALVVTLNVCQCHLAPENLGTARTVDRLVPWAQGYWDLYQSFWGTRPRFIAVSIVDTRDGAVMWRNGKDLLQEDEHGNKVTYAGTPRTGRVGRPHPGRVPGGRATRTRGFGA